MKVGAQRHKNWWQLLTTGEVYEHSREYSGFFWGGDESPN
jgi:hypothetical protein